MNGYGNSISVEIECGLARVALSFIEARDFDYSKLIDAFHYLLGDEHFEFELIEPYLDAVIAAEQRFEIMRATAHLTLATGALRKSQRLFH